MTNIFLRVSWILTEICSTLFEIVLSLFLTALVAPTLFILWFLNHIIRSIIQIFLYYYEPKIQLLSDGADGIWSYQKYGNSRNIIIVYIYAHRISLEKLQCNYNKLILNYISSNGTKPYNKLKKIFTTKYGYYCWKESIDFNIKNHVKYIFNEIDDIITETQLKELLPKLIIDMDDTKPQWEELIIPRFYYDHEMNNDDGKNNIIINEKSARIYRSHHSYMDGGSNLLMTGTCMGDCIKFPYIIDPLASLKISKWKKIFYNFTCILLGVKTIIKNLYDVSKLKSRFLMNKYSGHQIMSWSKKINMNILKETKDVTKTSIPSIVSTVFVTALQTMNDMNIQSQNSNGINNLPLHHCSSSSSLPEKTMSIGLVGAILPYDDISPKNRFTVVNFAVKTPPGLKRIDRLKITHQEFLRLSRRPDGLVNFKTFQIFGKFPSFVVQFIMRGAGTPVIYSNTPWATEKVTLWGDEVQDVFGWMPLLTTAGIGLLTVSYCDSFRVCVIADESCLSQTELNFLICELYNEIHLLHKQSKESELSAQQVICQNGIFIA